MSSVNQWIEQYGVLGVFLTAAAEGEIGVLIGGAMAHLGKLNPVMVALAAWAGSFLSTEAFFYIGRSQRDGRWVRDFKRRKAFAKTRQGTGQRRDPPLREGPAGARARGGGPTVGEIRKVVGSWPLRDRHCSSSA